MAPHATHPNPTPVLAFASVSPVSRQSDRRATYTRLCRVAEGGMGYVEVAMRQEGRFRRLYAVKRLHLHHRGDAGFRAMFMDEARLAGLVRHPNVVSVLDVGEDDDGPYLVMDYVDGVSLGTIIGRLSPADAALPLPLCVTIAAQVARGLHAAHELLGDGGELLGLVHRDVSPQNILVGFDGTARVTDFGIAKAFGNVNRTATGLLKGNVGYMAPEQLRFETPDRRADLFSLGVVLYEALARRRLYRNTDPNLSARRILSEPPPDIHEIRADAPPELVQLLFQLLAKETELRPASAHEVAERLEGVLALIDGAEGRFDLGTFLGANFSELREQRRRAIADALAAVQGPPVGEAETVRVAPVRKGTESAAPTALPSPTNAALPSVVLDEAPRPKRYKRALTLALTAAGLGGALLVARRPGPVAVRSSAPAAPVPAAATAASATAAPATEPVMAAPSPSEAARSSPLPTAAAPSATEPAVAPLATKSGEGGRTRFRAVRRPSAQASSPKEPALDPAEPAQRAPVTVTDPGLVHLPRREQSGSRNLEVPLVTKWQ